MPRHCFRNRTTHRGNKTTWKTEPSQRSLTVDLRQDVLSPKHLTAWVNSSQEHIYVHNQPRLFIKSHL